MAADYSIDPEVHLYLRPELHKTLPFIEQKIKLNSKDNPASVAQIQSAYVTFLGMSINEIDVELLIKILRRHGNMICHCRKGYYYSKSKKHTEKFLSTLIKERDRINTLIDDMEMAMRLTL